MRKIVFDIETTNFFAEVGSSDPAALELAVVVIHDSERDVYEHFFEADLPRLWQILEKADLLVGFNTEHFDIPLLNKYYSGDLTKVRSLDILKEIKKSYGRRMKLDQIAEGTLGINKSGGGLQSTVWWKRGEYDKVVSYCTDDVKITKAIYEYALLHNHLKFKEGGIINIIPLDTSRWETPSDSAITHTLPF
jgi:DEAD/DEAH box helicase domain-containing protein